MASQAPQPIQTVTYFNIQAIRREIQDMGPHASESHVYGVWDAKLNWMFPVTAGYITRPQYQHSMYGGRKGFSGFHTFEFINNTRRSFLITQCKFPEGEGWKSTWDEGAAQLMDYLSAQHGTRPVAARTPVYGILAVGRRVRFFKYNDVTQNVVGWLPPTGMTREWYYNKDEASLVQGALNQILQNH